MLIFLQNNIDHIGIAVNGIGESLPLLYRALGYKSDEMSHYYVTNNKSDIKLISSPKIIIIQPLKIVVLIGRF